MEEDMVTYDSKALVEKSQFTIMDAKNQVALIHNVLKEIMIEDIHYGIIPGCDKPTLYKAGAEKICAIFRLAPKYRVTRIELQNGHREYEIITELYHISSGLFLGEGVGTCSTMEAKHRYINKAMKCPKCGKESIIKGKAEFGGGWLCWKKKDGCGAKFEDKKELGKAGKEERKDIADVYNTVFKVAKKRSQNDCVLTATAASDIFAQDIEDLPEDMINNTPKPKPANKIINVTPPKETTESAEPTPEEQQDATDLFDKQESEDKAEYNKQFKEFIKYTIKAKEMFNKMTGSDEVYYGILSQDYSAAHANEVKSPKLQKQLCEDLKKVYASMKKERNGNA